MRRMVLSLLACSALAAVPADAAARDVPVSLRGSPASMVRQNAVAKEEGLPFARTPAELRRLADEGELVPLEPNGDFAFREGMSASVARTEMRTFIERLAAQYREGCGERLVVTSLTRAASRQPGNAHALSVHPAGMAVDLRVSQRAACRAWLEGTLLSLERRGILDVTREQRPPHYHVALFPAAYREHLERIAAADAPPAEPVVPEPVPSPTPAAVLPPAAAGAVRALAAAPTDARRRETTRGATLAGAAGVVLTLLVVAAGHRHVTRPRRD